MSSFTAKITAEHVSRALELRSTDPPMPWRAVARTISAETRVTVTHASILRAVHAFERAVAEDAARRADLAAAEALARPFRCDCGERFETETERNDHARAAHPEPLPSRPAPDLSPSGGPPPGWQWHALADHETAPPGAITNSRGDAILVPLPAPPQPQPTRIPKDRGRVGRPIAYERVGGGPGDTPDSPHLGRDTGDFAYNAKGNPIYRTSSRQLDVTADITPKPADDPRFGKYSPYAAANYSGMYDDLAPRAVFT